MVFGAEGRALRPRGVAVVARESATVMMSLVKVTPTCHTVSDCGDMTFKFSLRLSTDITEPPKGGFRTPPPSVYRWDRGTGDAPHGSLSLRTTQVQRMLEDCLRLVGGGPLVRRPHSAGGWRARDARRTRNVRQMAAQRHLHTRRWQWRERRPGLHASCVSHIYPQ